MNANTALHKSQLIIEAAGLKSRDYKCSNFLEYGPFVVDIIQHHWSESQRKNCPWLSEWLEAWKVLYGDWEQLVRADPGIQYRPQHAVAEAFHQSRAFIRYCPMGNRTGKTQSAYMEHYWFLTGNHPYRELSKVGSRTTFLVGYDFTNYLTKVFGPKMLSGEAGNYLSPLFPEDGKWFYNYDKKNHTLYIACPECAEEGKARSCPGHHAKSSMTLYSDERGWESLQGFAAHLGHFDEHITNVKTYQEAQQRLLTVPGSSFIITGTPKHGEDTWENVLLTPIADGPPEKNRITPSDPNSPPLVELFRIDQYSAGLASREDIDKLRQTMDEFEIQACIYGNPAPISEIVVFDRTKLARLKEIAREPRRGALKLLTHLNLKEVTGEEEQLISLIYAMDVEFSDKAEGPLRVWESPQPNAKYLISVDTAAGLAPGNKKHRPDYSCASVFKWIPEYTKNGVPKLELVAQYHGWVNLSDYASEIKKLGVFYNYALVAIELTGGYGTAVMERLRRRLGYWNLFRDQRKPEDIGFTVTQAGPTIHDPMVYRYGVETNISTKPQMVGNLQTMILMEQMGIPCKDTIHELVAFTQERSEKGIVNRFKGAGTAKDDRVMSLAIAAYIAVSYPLEAYFQGLSIPSPALRPNEPKEWAKIRQEFLNHSPGIVRY